MNSWKQFVSRATVMAALTGLAACGGGDGGSGITSITASQQAADDFVVEVNALVDDIRQADAADQIPAAGPFGLSGLSAPSSPDLPTGAVMTETMECSEFGTSGSGNVALTMDYNSSSGKPNSISFTYNDCTFGDAEYTYSIDGTGRMTFEDFVDETEFTFVLEYDLTYSYSGGGVQDTVSVESTEICTIDGELSECRYRFGDYDVASFSVETEGSITTIYEATIQSADVTIVFNDWVHDSDLGRATSGTVLITDSDGNSAEITATGTGYTVETVVDGATSTWTVTLT